MNNNLQLEIVTPFGKTLSEEILSCVVPGVKGQFQVLKNHAPVISICRRSPSLPSCKYQTKVTNVYRSPFSQHHMEDNPDESK